MKKQFALKKKELAEVFQRQLLHSSRRKSFDHRKEFGSPRSAPVLLRSQARSSRKVLLRSQTRSSGKMFVRNKRRAASAAPTYGDTRHARPLSAAKVAPLPSAELSRKLSENTSGEVASTHATSPPRREGSVPTHASRTKSASSRSSKHRTTTTTRQRRVKGDTKVEFPTSSFHSASAFSSSGRSARLSSTNPRTTGYLSTNSNRFKDESKMVDPISSSGPASAFSSLSRSARLPSATPRTACSALANSNRAFSSFKRSARLSSTKPRATSYTAKNSNCFKSEAKSADSISSYTSASAFSSLGRSARLSLVEPRTARHAVANSNRSASRTAVNGENHTNQSRTRDITAEATSRMSRSISPLSGFEGATQESMKNHAAEARAKSARFTMANSSQEFHANVKGKAASGPQSARSHLSFEANTHESAAAVPLHARPLSARSKVSVHTASYSSFASVGMAEDDAIYSRKNSDNGKAVVTKPSPIRHSRSSSQGFKRSSRISLPQGRRKQLQQSARSKASAVSYSPVAPVRTPENGGVISSRKNSHSVKTIEAKPLPADHSRSSSHSFKRGVPHSFQRSSRLAAPLEHRKQRKESPRSEVSAASYSSFASVCTSENRAIESSKNPSNDIKMSSVNESVSPRVSAANYSSFARTRSSSKNASVRRHGNANKSADAEDTVSTRCHPPNWQYSFSPKEVQMEDEPKLTSYKGAKRDTNMWANAADEKSPLFGFRNSLSSIHEGSRASKNSARLGFVSSPIQHANILESLPKLKLRKAERFSARNAKSSTRPLTKKRSSTRLFTRVFYDAKTGRLVSRPHTPLSAPVPTTRYKSSQRISVTPFFKGNFANMPHQQYRRKPSQFRKKANRFFDFALGTNRSSTNRQNRGLVREPAFAPNTYIRRRPTIVTQSPSLNLPEAQSVHTSPDFRQRSKISKFFTFAFGSKDTYQAPTNTDISASDKAAANKLFRSPDHERSNSFTAYQTPPYTSAKTSTRIVSPSPSTSAKSTRSSASTSRRESTRVVRTSLSKRKSVRTSSASPTEGRQYASLSSTRDSVGVLTPDNPQRLPTRGDARTSLSYSLSSREERNVQSAHSSKRSTGVRSARSNFKERNSGQVPSPRRSIRVFRPSNADVAEQWQSSLRRSSPSDSLSPARTSRPKLSPREVRQGAAVKMRSSDVSNSLKLNSREATSTQGSDSPLESHQSANISAADQWHNSLQKCRPQSAHRSNSAANNQSARSSSPQRRMHEVSLQRGSNNSLQTRESADVLDADHWQRSLRQSTPDLPRRSRTPPKRHLPQSAPISNVNATHRQSARSSSRQVKQSERNTSRSSKSSNNVEIPAPAQWQNSLRQPNSPSSSRTSRQKHLVQTARQKSGLTEHSSRSPVSHLSARSRSNSPQRISCRASSPRATVDSSQLPNNADGLAALQWQSSLRQSTAPVSPSSSRTSQDRVFHPSSHSSKTSAGDRRARSSSPSRTYREASSPRATIDSSQLPNNADGLAALQWQSSLRDSTSPSSSRISRPKHRSQSAQRFASERPSDRSESQTNRPVSSPRAAIDSSQLPNNADGLAALQRQNSLRESNPPVSPSLSRTSQDRHRVRSAHNSNVSTRHQRDRASSSQVTPKRESSPRSTNSFSQQPNNADGLAAMQWQNSLRQSTSPDSSSRSRTSQERGRRESMRNPNSPTAHRETRSRSDHPSNKTEVSIAEEWQSSLRSGSAPNYPTSSHTYREERGRQRVRNSRSSASRSLSSKSPQREKRDEPLPLGKIDSNSSRLLSNDEVLTAQQWQRSLRRRSNSRESQSQVHISRISSQRRSTVSRSSSQGAARGGSSAFGATEPSRLSNNACAAKQRQSLSSRENTQDYPAHSFTSLGNRSQNHISSKSPKESTHGHSSESTSLICNNTVSCASKNRQSVHKPNTNTNTNTRRSAPHSRTSLEKHGRQSARSSVASADPHHSESSASTTHKPRRRAHHSQPPPLAKAPSLQNIETFDVPKTRPRERTALSQREPILERSQLLDFTEENDPVGNRVYTNIPADDLKDILGTNSTDNSPETMMSSLSYESSPEGFVAEGHPLSRSTSSTPFSQCVADTQEHATSTPTINCNPNSLTPWPQDGIHEPFGAPMWYAPHPTERRARSSRFDSYDPPRRQEEFVVPVAPKLSHLEWVRAQAENDCALSQRRLLQGERSRPIFPGFMQERPTRSARLSISRNRYSGT